jgi:hypothetical protein
VEALRDASFAPSRLRLKSTDQPTNSPPCFFPPPPAPKSHITTNEKQDEEGDNTVLLIQCKSRPRPGNLAIKLFELEGSTCRADVEAKMRAVARELRDRNQELLGSLLFSCNGRGPARFLDLHGAAAGIDARAFTAAFPNTPVAGFYCMGEIGPQSIWSEPAAAAVEEQPASPLPSTSGSGMEADPLQVVALAASQTGSSALQGFTAVFGVLCVPKRSAYQGSALLERLHRHGTAAALACVLQKRAPQKETAAAAAAAAAARGVGAGGGGSVST